MEGFEPEKLELGIDEHDFIFFFGDLNYRLDLSISEVKRLIVKKQFDLLLKYDQLKDQKSKGSMGVGFEEGKINFQPTYKYDLDTNIYDTSEKQRTPAWTDRILTKVQEPKIKNSSIEQIDYDSIMKVGLSDHKPVRGYIYRQTWLKSWLFTPFDSLDFESFFTFGTNNFTNILPIYIFYRFYHQNASTLLKR